ncbi:MAG: Fe-only nitrogenase accessory protein AnfO, partial [Rhizomicrobium sp.]
PEGWQSHKVFDFAITSDMSLADVKRAVQSLALRLEDCRVFLASESRGLLYSILEDELGFHSWRSHGLAMALLDEIAALEIKRQAAAEAATATISQAATCGLGCGGGGRRTIGLAEDSATAAPVSAEPVGDGGWRIDLSGALAAHPALNSREILVPLLEAGNFAWLEVLCDHLPRWFSQKLTDLNLRADIDATGTGLRVQVFPNQ